MELAFVATVGGPHAGARVLASGAPLAVARHVLVLAHGRGATAEDILDLGRVIAPGGWALLAPQAVGETWYPNRFLAPLVDNEPWLSSALATIAACVDFAARAGHDRSTIALAGFSQGACLALEFAARAPGRWAALLGFAGGRIGPLETTFPPATASFEGTPVLLSCGVPDPHIPESRVRETEAWFVSAGARVEMRLVPGLGHTIEPAAARRARALLESA